MDDDAYDAYPKISDNVLNSPEGGVGNILIATPLMTPESRTTTTTSPRSIIVLFFMLKLDTFINYYLISRNMKWK